MSQSHGQNDPRLGPNDGQDRRRIDTRAAARIAGVAPSTWRAWRSQGRPRPEPAPEPDGWRELRTPWWWESTIVAWAERRRETLAGWHDNQGGHNQGGHNQNDPNQGGHNQGGHNQNDPNQGGHRGP